MRARSVFERARIFYLIAYVCVCVRVLELFYIARGVITLAPDTCQQSTLQQCAIPQHTLPLKYE